MTIEKDIVSTWKNARFSEWILDPDYLMNAYRSDKDMQGRHALTRTSTGLSCFIAKAGYCMLVNLTPDVKGMVWKVEGWEQFGNWGDFEDWGPSDGDQLELALHVSSVTERPSLTTEFFIRNAVDIKFMSANLIEFYDALDNVADRHIAHLYTKYLCGLVDGLTFGKVSFHGDQYEGFSMEGSWRGQKIQFASDNYGFASMACIDSSERNLWMSSLTLLTTSVNSDGEWVTYKEIRELLADAPHPANPIPRQSHGTSLFETSETYSPMEFAVLFGILIENVTVTDRGTALMKDIPDLVPSVPAPFGTIMYGEPKEPAYRQGLFSRVRMRIKWKDKNG